ncbi:uncharacterized protein E0L32_004161 [Thyridium curvatum]|uniref:Uncharacterized protein n=1 Tax=Thyridium curvatum TaxID=1093900 RepID=A0A507BAD2_9PEZI|nr:uncharacterized protein E0L32_004161 [Thyridium curvatum]TPX16166.1 hypothetical protein E0L32_004161 [Thyridium curvatum]
MSFPPPNYATNRSEERSPTISPREQGREEKGFRHTESAASQSSLHHRFSFLGPPLPTPAEAPPPLCLLTPESITLSPFPSNHVLTRSESERAFPTRHDSPPSLPPTLDRTRLDASDLRRIPSLLALHEAPSLPFPPAPGAPHGDLDSIPAPPQPTPSLYLE